MSIRQAAETGSGGGPTHPKAYSMRKVNVAVISPNHFFREGVRQLLRGTAYDVVADVGSVRRASALSDYADLNLLILSPGKTDNVEAEIAWVRTLAHARAIRIVALMDIGDADAVRRVAAQGIDAILSTSTPVEVFPHMLDMVLLGQHVFPAVVQTMATAKPAASKLRQLAVPIDGAAGSSADSIDSAGLSKREAQILNLLVDGASNKSIARQLLVTEPTVKAHVKGLLRKIRVSNRTQAAIWALNQARATGSPMPLMTRPGPPEGPGSPPQPRPAP